MVANELEISTNALKNSSPSLLRQIIDEVDDLDNEKKEALLWRIKLEKALALSMQADEAFEDKFLPLTDEEITSIVSTNRKVNYDAKIHHCTRGGFNICKIGGQA